VPFCAGIDLTTISAEGKHLLPLMLRSRPGDRATLDAVLAHPLFWTTEKQLQYLSEIGGLLPDCVHRSQHALTDEIEKLLDSNLGPYNALRPEVGGSWSRAFSDSYPSGATGWGSSQRSPESEEHDYFIFGESSSSSGGGGGGGGEQQPKAKEIRGVGFVKFLVSVYTQRAQHVEAFRFPSEHELCTWLLEPFPFLLMGVFEADERCRLSTGGGGGGGGGSSNGHRTSREQQERQQEQHTGINPLSADL
jgi:hypothetical protein